MPLNGNAGNDLFSMTVDNARDAINGGAGTSDTADYSAFTANLGVTLGNNVAVAGNGTGLNTDLISGIENFTGGAGNDSITGDGSVNRLSGRGWQRHADRWRWRHYPDGWLWR